MNIRGKSQVVVLSAKPSVTVCHALTLSATCDSLSHPHPLTLNHPQLYAFGRREREREETRSAIIQ
jgi:hypothetical protein